MFEDLLSMIFPKYCLMCMDALAKGEDQICIHCRYNMPVTNHHLGNNAVLSDKFIGKVPIKHAWAYLTFTKEGNVQKALHKLKYKGEQQIGIVLGRWYGAELKSEGLDKEFDLIIPVPLHPSKLKKRGYNQSDTFAQGLSEVLNVSWNKDLLKKGTANETQTHKKRLERWQNVKDVYFITDQGLLFNKRILLVDDVITTGSTLEACALVLLREGCKDVSIVTIATA